MKINLQLNPEWSFEFVQAVPYAYWLHQHDLLGSICTSTDMKCFYYFADDVREIYNTRTIDNSINGLQSLPNPWIHHNTSTGNWTEDDIIRGRHTAVLDYSQWIAPPYKLVYKNDIFPTNTVFILNKCNSEWGNVPVNFIDPTTLYKLFWYLSDDYTVIYKRSTDHTIDENEQYMFNIQDRFPNGELMTDFQVCDMFPNVHTIQEIQQQHPEYSLNTLQMMIAANCDKFITVQGGNSHFAGFFGKNINLIFEGKELRPGYFTNPGNWYSKLGGDVSYPIHVVRSYDELIQTVKDEY